jgi:adenine-specific DNA-methyltransferase
MANTLIVKSIQDKRDRIHSRFSITRAHELEILEKKKQSLTDYVEQLTEDYIADSSLKNRKARGQFFTPKEIALFMASMFDINGQHFSILDPGAGMGMLSAAFCERLLELDKKVSLLIDAYETDSNLIPYLTKVLKKCKLVLEEKGHTLSYRIIDKDFILNNPNYLNKGTLFERKDSMAFYDYIISNPPYYKLNKNSVQAKVMKEFVSGQPNIYTFFMALSLEMLKPHGQMVFITPRSFCSGLYFKKFRKWLLQQSKISNIHIFESRSEIFDKDEVLQENIIIKLTPKGDLKKQGHVIITKSKDKFFHGFQKKEIDYQDILHQKNGDIFIKIPTTKTDISIQHIINSWSYTLKDFGIEVSTGPVVSFRAKRFLFPEFKDKKTTAPLLWMHNIQDMSVIWPLQKNKKETSIKIEEKTKPLLVPVRNYVLVKRFSSKEQKRRLYAGVLLGSEFSFNKVGIENHLNYIYNKNGELSVDETYGIAGILNTSLLDIFFRMINGSTQVNAVDIRNLPFPSLENIKRIGELVRKTKPSVELELDRLVINVLNIDPEIIGYLNGGDKKNEQD